MTPFEQGFYSELEKIAAGLSPLTKKPAAEMLTLIKKVPTLARGRAEVSEMQRAIRAAKAGGKDPYTDTAALDALRKAKQVAV
jgi:hypothetical protein